jgi:nucleoside-diphosphate kinase
MTKTHYHERTLVLIKPDAVQRALIGEILARFERKGLKIVAMKMVWPTKQLAKEHYGWSEKEKRESGERTIQGYQEKGMEPPLGGDPIKIAENTMRKLVSYISAGPVVALVIEGAHAIANVRKIRGGTNPTMADAGTITADYSIDSYFISDDADRAVRNLVHASGNSAEAEREIKLWFKENEIVDYDLAIEKILYDKEWEDAMKQLVKA